MDLTGIHLFPEYTANADETPTMEEKVDLESDSSDFIFLHLRAAGTKKTSASLTVGQVKAPSVDAQVFQHIQIKQGKEIAMPITAEITPQWGVLEPRKADIQRADLCLRLTLYDGLCHPAFP